MDLLGEATFTVDLISAPDQPGRKRMYHYKRYVKSVLSLYIMWLIHNVAYLHRRLLLRYTHVHKWWLIFTPVYVIEIHLFFWIWSLSSRSKKLGTLLHYCLYKGDEMHSSIYVQFNGDFYFHILLPVSFLVSNKQGFWVKN